MVTNSQGDKGYYVDNTTGQRCTPNTDGTYDMNKCRFDTVIRGTAAGGFGQKIHTRKQEKGLPDSNNMMWAGCFDTTLKKVKKNKVTGETYTVSQLVDVTKDKCIGPKYRWDPNHLRDNEESKKKTLSDIVGQINNGRVNDANITSNVTHTRRGDVLMRDDNQETSVKGIVEETALSNIFFSSVNINIIQQTLRYKVYERTKMVVDYQSPEALYIVMRSILLQHGNFKVGSNDLGAEIRKLNFLVTKYCIHEVSSNVLQYKGYISDLESLPTPMDRPGYHDHKSRNRTFDLSHVTLGAFGVRHRQR